MSRFSVYRHYDADDVLLYVGRTTSILARTPQHLAGAPWAERIVRISVEWFGTKAESEAAEAAAIDTEDPLFNKRGGSFTHINEISKLIGEWPTRRDFAEHVGANLHVVNKWIQNARIPGWYHMPVIKAAAEIGVDYATADWLCLLHARAPNKQLENTGGTTL